MDGLPNNLILWVWWFFSVVIVGILINIASPYIQARLEKMQVFLSETKRKESESRKKEFEEKVSSLMSNQTLVVETQLDMIYLFLRIIGTMIVGIFVLLGISFIFSFLTQYSEPYLQTPVHFVYISSSSEKINNPILITSYEEIIFISKYLVMTIASIAFIWKISHISSELQKIRLPFIEYKTMSNQPKETKKR